MDLALASVPLISLDDDPARLPSALGTSFRAFGFAMVRNHGIDEGLIAEGWRLTREFFALPEAEKRAYFLPDTAGARGYTPTHDLKEFWHIGRDLPPGHPLLSPSMPANIWPVALPGFAATFRPLYQAFETTGARILSHIATHLGLAPDWFAPAIANGNSVLRLLHYPPIAGATGEAIRAGAHEDINLITLLLGAEEAGLELLAKDGSWLPVSPPKGALVINIGDMLQRLTNHALPSTSHRVRNPDAARAGVPRYAMPFFLHLRPDFVIETLPQCVSDAHPNRYPSPILADDYLQERLREIGLRG